MSGRGELFIGDHGNAPLVFEECKVNGVLKIVALHQGAVRFDSGLGRHEPCFGRGIGNHVTTEAGLVN